MKHKSAEKKVRKGWARYPHCLAGTRIPEALHVAIAASAARLGISYAERVRSVLMMAHGLPGAQSDTQIDTQSATHAKPATQI